MLEIRVINCDSIGIVQPLFFDLFTKEPWNDDWSDQNQLYQYLQDLMGNRNSLSFGLFDENTFVGFSIGNVTHWCRGTEYYIMEFGIRTDYQGRGIGTDFLSKVINEVKERGITNLYLQTERTVPAYEFYQRNGFTDLKDHASLYLDI